MAVATDAVRPLKGAPRAQRSNRLFTWILIAATVLTVGVLLTLLLNVLFDGIRGLEPHLLTDYPSRRPAAAGARSAILGTAWLMGLTAVVSVPVGFGAAIYLEEFAPSNKLTRAIETNIANLAGVPSVVYGLLALGVFVRALHMGTILFVGALTLSLLVLPIVIIASREALRAVPAAIREGAFALGATRWEVVRHQVLPAATPGMMTGTILALSRAIGETAPLAVLGAFAYVAFDPTPFSDFTALPIQILSWVVRPQPEFVQLAAATSIVLLVMLLAMNAIAIVIRNRQRRSW
jgi:phosphate transport system permease protein